MIDKAEEYRDMTLAEALAHADEARWKGRRQRPSNMSQAKQALDTLALLVRPGLEGATREEIHAAVRHDEVTPEHLRAAVKAWRKTSLGPVTINRRVVCLSVLGYETKNLYTPLPKTLKWWLKPDQQEVLLATLNEWGGRADRIMAGYIVWATQTGLRVEESLRLTRADFSELTMRDEATGGTTARVVVTVPGLKTADAQATLPLTAKAEEVYRMVMGPSGAPGDRLFPISYEHLSAKWRECKIVLGVVNNRNATLKALRRVAARNLHAGKGMPLDVVRTYLRHENIQTTMGYLRLTGGYGAEEIARYL